MAWYVRLSSGIQSADEMAAFAAWHAADHDHARAWSRLQGMGLRLQHCSERVEAPVARATLTRLPDLARRRTIRTLCWAGGGSAALYLARAPLIEHIPLATALADHRTATGERRDLTLADGTRVMLNTATAIDVRFDARERRIELLGGEILVTTARAADPRPLRIATRDGTLTPVGTRFAVRKIDDRHAAGSTWLAVSAGAVDVRTASAVAYDGEHAAAVRIEPGQMVDLDRRQVGTPTALDDARLSWSDGMLSAEGKRLTDFVAELGRYRTGMLRCDPALAELRITGTWPLDGPEPTDRILDSLARSLPVRIHRRTRYWVVIGPV